VSVDPKKLLAAIPAGLRDLLLEEYQKIASNYAEQRWEPSELSGGKFSECVYWICHDFVTGKTTSAPSKPLNMRDDCRAIEGNAKTSKPGDRSMRILIPRMLPALYEIRNNRGVGHVGGDVNPNHMDATVIYSMASYIIAELVAVFHQVTTAEAQEAVDAIVERKFALVWDAGTVKRVLDDGMKTSDQTLLLLHQAAGWVPEKDLVASVEYSSGSMFRSRVLTPLHKARMIEHDASGTRARISPKGSAHVEEKIIRPLIK
jgi:hypothetical protein